MGDNLEERVVSSLTKLGDEKITKAVSFEEGGHMSVSNLHGGA